MKLHMRDHDATTANQDEKASRKTKMTSQLSKNAQISKRNVIVDNNTWNNTHIATVGCAMSSYEDEACEIMQCCMPMVFLLL
jgi:hypothetical protein